MTYFIHVAGGNGLNSLASNPCTLLDFQRLMLQDGEVFEGSTAGREVLAVIFGGRGNFRVNGQDLGRVGGRPNVFAGKPHSVYIPCQSTYSVTASGSLEIGLCSAPSDLAVEPYVIGPDVVTSGVWGAANFTRSFHQILTEAGQPELPAARLIVGETYVPSGNWSTYPAHKHEKDDLPREAFHEEMYFFKVSPAEGFGMTRLYNQEMDHGFVIHDNTILMIPYGYHTTNSAPGYTCYFLWFLAGNHRTQAVVEDPAFQWVSRTVPMLRALGH